MSSRWADLFDRGTKGLPGFDAVLGGTCISAFLLLYQEGQKAAVTADSWKAETCPSITWTINMFPSFL